MLDNPFTPVFGGKPDFFFGRKELLARFSRALKDRGSEDRTLFVTATRGMGKTALVEQLSLNARSRGWRVIDLGPENTVHALVRRLAGFDEQSKTVDPQESVNVLGSGASLEGMSTTKTLRADSSDLDLLLIQACEHEKNGVMVTIDEIQKLAEHDVSAISNAFQMASRKGCEAILVMAGLPYAYDEIGGYEGCTFMRRASHVRLGLLSHEEVSEAFETIWHGDTSLPDESFARMVAASLGHPYMVQLLGYYLVERLNSLGIEPSALPSEQLMDVIHEALDAYCSRALRPLVKELTGAEHAYLTATARALDAERLAPVARIGELLGKDSKQTSSVRSRLLKQGLLIAPRRGSLRFTVPYLADYLLQPTPEEDEAHLLREWGV